MKVSSTAAALLLSLASTVSAANIQLSNLQLPSNAAANKKLVTDAFSSAYADYKKYAFGHDDLAPVSKGYVDSRNGWGATIVDALSTMTIMGLNDIFAEGVDYTANIDFSRSKTSDRVSLFETTIRYLGGMLSAYELGGQKDARLVQQAVKLGNKLAKGWVGSNALPFNSLDFSTDKPAVEINNIAQAGTLVLEFNRLTKYSGNKTYQQLADKAMRAIATNPAPLPGLAPQNVNPQTGKPDGDYITWGGGSDSYFEYLIKYARLTNNADPLWVKTWQTAVDSSIRTLFTKTSVANLTFLTDYSASRKRYLFSHLGCFVGGNWIMGGRMLNNATIVDYGLKLVDSCIHTYQSTATGIGPEVFAFKGADGGSYTGGPAPSSDDLAFYNKNGFYVYNGYAYYDLRPEVLESNFYAWRATGNVKYQQNAETALKAILKATKAPLAYAPINDVRSTNSGFIDDTESFFFAELMKYLYLTFDDPKHISLDEWVFNTEAHPFRAPAPLGTYQPPTGTKTGSDAPFDGNRVQGLPLPQISPASKLPKQLTDVLRDVGAIFSSVAGLRMRWMRD